MNDVSAELSDGRSRSNVEDGRIYIADTRTDAASPCACGFQLNPDLDTAALSTAFAARERLQIACVLDHESAERLYQHLATDMEWTLLLSANKRTYHVSAKRAGVVTTDDPRVLAHAYGGATDGFAFVYATHRRSVTPESDAGGIANTVLATFFDFLNTPAFMTFARAVTGNMKLSRATAQATCFRAGHFLNFHTDSDAGKKIAYVLNLSRDWKAEWGGLLQFADHPGAVTDCFLPSFNSLSMFAVPQWHAVSFVTPFAGHPRYAVSGWLHEE